jgi:hypothetical protein
VFARYLKLDGFAVGLQDGKKEAPKLKDAPPPAKPAWQKVRWHAFVGMVMVLCQPCSMNVGLIRMKQSR